ncbi:MAG: hypothetical protein KDA20_00810 [Phycisphaerales bacterium]|nr:hypothetical protein [Phycisphaerales bacterium]
MLLLLLVVPVLAACERSPDVTATTLHWNGQEFATRLTTPKEPTSDVTVIMLGGGFAFDEHWTTPASYDIEGSHVNVTIDGVDYHDADTITAELVKRGFRVFQWSSIPSDDATGLANPALARGATYRQLRELSQAAVAHACTLDGVKANRIVLLGHSLGAARACQIADASTAGIAMLSGAYVSLHFMAPSKMIEQSIRATQKANALLGKPTEWSEERHLALYDFDKDGTVQDWEEAGIGDIAAYKFGMLHIDKDIPADFEGDITPVRLLRILKVPKLAIYGNLDPTAVHAPALDFLKHTGAITRLELVVLPDLNHQLGRQVGDLTGPIDPAAVQCIGDWMTEHFASN